MTSSAVPAAAGDARPIGVFDSGVGGLSVLAALRALLPHEHFVYYGDTAHAPYGERGDDYVVARSLAVARMLIEQQRIKALVVACNTATAPAIHLLREAWPQMPLVGLEPGLKPGAAATRTGRIAVLATRGTLGSAKFARLRDSLPAGLEVRAVPCDGLAAAIEQNDAARIDALAARYLQAAGPLGTHAGAADTVVLGCTHYPFVLDVLRTHAPAGLRFIDTGVAVAQQTARLLQAGGLLRAAGDAGAATLQLLASGDPQWLQQAAERWLPAMAGTPEMAAPPC